MRDTIAAIASPPGPARRGVIRVSGARAAELLLGCVRLPDGARPRLAERALFHAWLDDGRGEQPVLVLWMPGPRSYTREDVAELHLVGAEVLLAAALERLLELGARVAQPGEFTRRAFEHGRIDLSRAEGVLELVSASSAAEHRAALALLGGGLEQRLAPLRERLADARALAEAALDFSEDDTGAVPLPELAALVEALRAGLARTLEFEVERVAPPVLPRVLLVGAPNAGKSSLYNALVGAERALVTPIAGTTRDWLAARWSAGGVEVELVDTPGIDEAADGLDRTAQRRARELVATAALCVWAIDAGTESEPRLDAAAQRLARRDAAPVAWLGAWTKRDALGPPGPREHALARRCETALPGCAGWVALSAHRGVGIAELGASVARWLRGSLHADTGVARELSARHRAALERALAELGEVERALQAHAAWDLAAEHLRRASEALDELSGRTTTEDVLDRIFARFCLGK